ncbi:hypothetical protein [Capnocytophaga cynodegmi]|uniref:hypothetical protein n=1 Tax=Capnocytophaga cynodegmi TaxID=28189 RepID=UPI001E58518E|nr:hypothetical protein [Capnocytophaga cynodegmi]
MGSPAHRQHPIQSLQQYPPRFQQDLVQDLILVVAFLPVKELSADRSEQKSDREWHRITRIVSAASYIQTLVLSPKP